MTLYIAHSTGNWFIRDGMWGAEGASIPTIFSEKAVNIYMYNY